MTPHSASQPNTGHSILLVALSAALLVSLSLLLVPADSPVRRRIAAYIAHRDQLKKVAAAWDEASQIASRYQGNDNAPVVVFEIVDYECPYCRKSHTAIQALGSATSEVGVALLQYPLESIHPHARKAATYALCAEEQGKFSEATDYFFTHTEWGSFLPSHWGRAWPSRISQPSPSASLWHGQHSASKLTAVLLTQWVSSRPPP